MLQMSIRALCALVVLFVITRIGGKKQLAQLTFFEYVVGITIGDIAAFVSTDVESNLVHGYTSLAIWGLVPLGIEFLSLKSKWVRDLFEGKGRVLVKNGKIMEDNLKKEHYSTDELLEQLRLKNAFKVADVEFAVLETNGDLSVLLKKDAMPATVSDLGLVVPSEREAQTVIMDGKIIDEGLATAGFNEKWLHTELEKIGVSLDNIYVAQVDTFGQLYVDLYDDKIKVPAPSAKKLTLSTLKKCQADIELFALASQSEKAKQIYTDAADKLQQTLERVTPYLK
jgi:uncharacterized membrane protein YcaP (DUF421 family)